MPTPDPWATLLHFLSTSVFRYDPAMSERVLGMIAAARAAIDLQHQQQVAALTAQLAESNEAYDNVLTSWAEARTELSELRERMAVLDPTHPLRDTQGSK